MHFSENIVAFDFAGTTVIGNLNNGYSIGLSDNGKKICERLFQEELSEEELESLDETLYLHLNRGLFFEDSVSAASLELAYIHVTQRCNLECVGCYSLDRYRNKSHDPSSKDILFAISQLAKGGVKELVISGGEPFMRSDLPEIIAYAKCETSIKSITVATNGYFVEDEVIKRISPYVDLISVSFDGCSKDSIPYIRREQAFEYLVDTVKRIKAASIAVQITPTIHAKNYHDMDDYIRLANDLGVVVNYSLFSCKATNDEVKNLIPSNADLRLMGTKIFSLSQEYMNVSTTAPLGVNLSVRKACGAGAKQISVAADGSVYPCHMLNAPEFTLGNLYSESIEEIVDRKQNQLLKEGQSPSCASCEACGYKWLCGGGCKARAYYDHNDICLEDPYCPLFLSFYAAFDQHLQKQCEG